MKVLGWSWYGGSLSMYFMESGDYIGVLHVLYYVLDHSQ